MAIGFSSLYCLALSAIADGSWLRDVEASVSKTDGGMITLGAYPQISVSKKKPSVAFAAFLATSCSIVLPLLWMYCPSVSFQENPLFTHCSWDAVEDVMSVWVSVYQDSRRVDIELDLLLRRA